jgi:hypothetical protein
MRESVLLGTISSRMASHGMAKRERELQIGDLVRRGNEIDQQRRLLRLELRGVMGEPRSTLRTERALAVRAKLQEIEVEWWEVDKQIRALKSRSPK